MRTILGLGGALALALVMSACSSSDSNGGAQPGDQPTPDASPDVAQEAAPDSGDDAGDDASDGGAEASPDAGEDAPDADDGATDGGSDGSPEAGGFHVVAQCQQADYQDLTGVGATRDVSPWDTSLGKRCIKIAAGQTVTWNGGNTLPASHPLEAMSGDEPSPIASVSQSSPSVSFPTPGVYGFDCANHPTFMFGAIWVVP